MKILFVCENYFPHIGGAEVVFKNLAEGYVKQGHQVNLVTRHLKGTKKFETINGVKVHRVKSFNTRYLFTFAAIPKVIKLARKADVIQTTTFNGAPPASFAGMFCKKPVFLTIHEVWINKWHKVTNMGKLGCLVHNLLEKAIYLLPFTRYICVSKATQKDLSKLGKFKKSKLNQRKVKTIYNGMDYKFWDKNNFNQKDIKKKLDLAGKFVYFSWGRPGQSKGFEYAIRSAPLISKQIPNAVFLLMLGGIDKYPQEYKKLVQLIKKVRKQTGTKIKLIPKVPYNELGNYILAADCVVVPSIAEGFGYTTVESCTLGTPVVASKAGSIPEVISNKYILVTPKNYSAIAEGVITIKNKKYQTSPLKKFPWSEAIKQYLQEFKDVLKKK